MEFALSEDQRLMKDSIDRLLSDRYAFEQRKLMQREPDGWSRRMWRAYAELGLLALPFEERFGGLSGGAVETMIVMEAFGRALVLEPYFASVVLGGAILRHGAGEAHKQALLPPLASGELVLALAHHEPSARYNLTHVETNAQYVSDGWRLDGHKGLVLHGDSADRYIVSARTRGEVTAPDGIALFLVDAAAPGVQRWGYPTQDGLRAAEVKLDAVHVASADMLVAPSQGYAVLARAIEEGIAALCAEAVGCMQALHELTVDYLKQRRQFGVPIGSFQALQHRAVDMLIAIEQARSMAMYVTMMLAEHDAGARTKAVSAAKVQIGRSARFVGEQAIQLHGGIGMTMEYKAGHYFKRLTMIDVLFGDADHHLRKLARAGSLFD
ncbi:MAG TPA: acyl-CoA dehydrogenase family protein [Xanthobacteraceae bacterium]|nr:acyl-CoA dehydrogenase family protein [Xanthobacteraceae bacterium]